MTRLRVLVDATYAARAARSGTAVYTNRLLEALAAHDGLEVRAVADPRRGAPGDGALASARNLGIDVTWAAAGLPRLAAASGADVVHHTLPAFARAPGRAQVVTVHDLAFERRPDLFAPAFRRYAHIAHAAAARRADAVICVSHATAADAQELWGVPRARIVVAHHGPGQLSDRPSDGATTQRQAPGAHGWFLYIGDDEPRKALSTLLAAFRRYRATVEAALPLVLAGSADPSEADPSLAEPPEPGAASAAGIRVEREPGSARIAELLRGAVALVHPALIEGFGLTVLEAMSAGTPVVAARSPAVVEVTAGAAMLTPPGDAQALADAMLAVASDPALAADLAARGRRRAAAFSWAASARAHADAYSLAVQMATGAGR